MTEKKESEKKTIEISGVIGAMGQAYGPYAFGVVSLLIVWFSIVKPELNARQLDFATQKEIVDAQRANTEAQKSVATTMQSTAESMKITATILENIVSDINERNRE